MAAAQPMTGIANADELLTLARAFNLTVTVETKSADETTSHTLRITIPVPVAYAGTDLGRAIDSRTLTMLWTKSSQKGARGRLDYAIEGSATASRKVRTVRLAEAIIRSLGHDAAQHARATAPMPEDVVDAPHNLYFGDNRRATGLPAAQVRKIVHNRRRAGRLTHQDDNGGIHCGTTHRYVPQTDGETTPADAPVGERHHVRIVDGGTPQLIPTRDALDEMNTAMMQPGKREVRQMSESRGHARIVYKDSERGTVVLRPATAEDLAAVAARRPAAVVLAADPIPVDGTVLTDMPGESVGLAGVPTRDAVNHDTYVAQERNDGVWQLPNHDDGAHLTRAKVTGAIAYVRRSSDHARVSVDTDGTIYVSNGHRAARYIPAALIADYSADHCPGCSTPYASNGDGPCTGGRSLGAEERQRAAEKDQRRALAYAGRWWAEQGTDAPTDDALRAAFQDSGKTPRPELYPAIRDAITANTPPAAAAPLFAAHAAYEATAHAVTPRDLQGVALHMENLRRAAPRRLHTDIHAAAVAADDAWPALKAAGTLTERNAAHDRARAAVDAARAVILAVAPRANQMHGTDLPATDDAIRAAARAYNAVGSTPEEMTATEVCPALIRVQCRADSGTGWNVTAVITAGVDSPLGFIPAHPPLVVKFKRVNGRLNPADNARRVIGSLFQVDAPVEFVTATRA